VLFPVAAAFAALAVPLWLAWPTLPARVSAPAWHGHEMLFGYTLAVAAGFLVTRAARAAPWILLATWAAGRAAALFADRPLALLLGLSFPAVLFAFAAPPLLRGAKRWENRIVPAVVAGLFAADATWWIGALRLDADVQLRALLAGVDLFALLMLIVGGRALPAAVGGYLERQGIPRRDRIRRGYELPLAALIGGAGLLDGFGFGFGAGLLCSAAAVVTAARVIPWQLHRTLARPELWALALGYVWLVPGLLLKGIAQISGIVPVTHVLHGITVGALGTLTLVMMARTIVLQARRPLDRFRDIAAGALMITAAALLRLTAPLVPTKPEPLLWLAAAMWSAAFLLLFLRIVRTPRR